MTFKCYYKYIDSPEDNGKTSLKDWKEKYPCQLAILYPVEISLKNKGKDIQKPKVFMITRYIKAVLQA